ncbi:Legume-like lectin family protein [Ostertagia ostertagi]
MLWVAVVLLTLFFVEGQDHILPPLAGSRVDETRGYELREFQLVPPYSNHRRLDTIRKWLRLTREEPSLSGSVWSRGGIMARDWEIQAHLRISSDGMPADGMGIWYVERDGFGTAWGAPANFNGIGVVLDTYVNDGSDNSGQTIRLFLLVNTPTQGVEVNVNADGNNLKVLPECQFNFPLTMFVPSIKILIRYAKETVQVLYSLPKDNEEHWNHCTNATSCTRFSYEIETFRSIADRPVSQVQYYGGYLPSRTPKPSSFLSDVWTFMHMVVVLVLVMGILYGLYKITDKYIDDSFIMARPRKRFY